MPKVNRLSVVHFSLTRSSKLSPQQKAILHYIASYSDWNRPYYMKHMAEGCSMSERHLRRIIRSLVTLGLVIRKYGAYKRCFHKLADLQTQMEFVKDSLAHQLRVFQENIKRVQERKHRAALRMRNFSRSLIRPSEANSITEGNIKLNTQKELEIIQGRNLTLGPSKQERSMSFDEKKAYDLQRLRDYALSLGQQPTF